jgi:hypothetical protein
MQMDHKSGSAPRSRRLWQPHHVLILVSVMLPATLAAGIEIGYVAHKPASWTGPPPLSPTPTELADAFVGGYTVAGTSITGGCCYTKAAIVEYL